MLADRTGLTDALSAVVARRGFVPDHDRGRVLVDVATMITAGGEAIADIDTLRHQHDVLTTCWARSRHRRRCSGPGSGPPLPAAWTPGPVGRPSGQSCPSGPRNAR